MTQRSGYVPPSGSNLRKPRPQAKPKLLTPEERLSLVVNSFKEAMGGQNGILKDTSVMEAITEAFRFRLEAPGRLTAEVDERAAAALNAYLVTNESQPVDGWALAKAFNNVVESTKGMTRKL